MQKTKVSTPHFFRFQGGGSCNVDIQKHSRIILCLLEDDEIPICVPLTPPCAGHSIHTEHPGGEKDFSRSQLLVTY